MKKFLCLLLTVLIGFSGLRLSAQENTLLVANGTETSDYVPIYGYWADAEQHNQIIYPSSMLGDMQGGSITSMTFYLTGSPGWTNGFVVSLGITPVVNFPSATHNSSPVTQVCTGTINVQNNQLTFTFDTPYDYNGGNLLFDITTSSASYIAGTFYGVSTTYYSSLYYYYSYGYQQQFIPKTQFTFTGGATCLTPVNLDITNITTSSAVLSWQNQSAGTSMVAVDTFGADEDNLTWTTVSDTTYTFNGLSSGEHYQAFIRTDCGGGDLSGITSIDFYTDCDVVTTFPWNEDFEGDWVTTSAFGQTNSAPLCWKSYNGGTVGSGTDDYFWESAPYSEYAYQGTGAATMYSYYASGAHNDWLVTPMMALTGTQQVTFMARSSSTYYSLEEISVWISDENATLTAPESDTAALPGFTKIAQFNSLPTDYYLYEVSLEGYTGNRYIAFVRREAPYSAYYLCLDNVTVEESPSCTRPSALTVDSVNTTFAVLSWTSDADNFNLYYRTDDAADYTVINEVTLSADSTYTLTDLQPGQYYIWYVEAVCDEETTLSSLLTEQPSTFVTECVAVTDLPLTCDFEHNNGGENYTLPSCWSHLGFSSVYVDNSTYYAHSGSKMLYFYTSTPQVIVLPELSNDLTISNMQFSFWTRFDYSLSAMAYPALIEVGVITDPTNDTTFIPLDSLTGFTTSYTEFVSTFEGYEGDATHIAMRVNPGQYTYDGSYYYSNTLYIDDITLELIPSCPRPEDVTITDITNTSVSFSWTSEESSFMVYYRPSGTVAYTPIEDGPVVDTFYTLTDLLAATNYDVYVTSLCSDGTETQSVPFSFVTDCTPMDSLPYSCDFESALDNDMPMCWTRGNGSSYNYPYVYDYNGVDGSGSLCFYYVNTAAMPAIDTNEIDLTEYRVVFAGMSYNTGDQIQVGVMTDPVNVNTFTAVATITLSESYVTYEASLVTYQGNGAYVAFRNMTASSIYLDNVVLEPLPDCQRPTAFSASLGMDEATIYWNATEDQFEWEVAMGPAYGDPDTMQSETVSTNSYAMDNLTPNTSYTIFVRTLCGSESSVWSDPFTFTTLLSEPAAVPYICNFEDTLENANWVLLNGTETNKWFIDSAANNTDDGMYALYVSIDSGATNSYDYTSTSTIWAYRDIQFSDAEQFILSFDWRGYGESSYDYMKVFLGNPVTVNAGANTNPTGAVQLGFYNQQSTWQSETVILGGEYANTTKRLYFLWHNDNIIGTQPAAAVDNISITTVACARPAAVELISNGIYSVTIGITPANEDDQLWQVSINDSIFNVTSTVVTIDGLTPATDYVVKANTICDGGDTSVWSNSISFMTECVRIASVPQSWGFESDLIGYSYPMPMCWNRISGSNDYLYPYAYSYSDYAHTGIYSLYFYNYYGSSIAIMPAIDTDSLNIQDLEVSFYAVSSDYSGMVTMQVGVMTDPSDASTFTNVETVNLPNSYGVDPIIVSFENYTGTGNYIAFKSVVPDGSSSNIRIDDVVLEEIPACPTPSVVTVYDQGMTSATVSWTENGDATSWSIKISDGTTETTVIANTNPYTLNGLTSGTVYTLQVSSDCGTGEFSGWTLPITFNTTLCELADQCAYTFNLTDSYGDGWNGGSISVQQNGITMATVTLMSGTSGTQTVNLCNGDSTTLVWNVGSYDTEVSFTVTDPDGNEIYTSSGVASGPLFGFTTNCGGGSVVTDPTVATAPATNIAQTTATLNGVITNPDNVTITAQGFEWKLSTAADYTVVNAAGNAMTYDLSNLTPNTTYTYRAFITFDGTTQYGSDETFTTLEQGQLTEPSATTAAATAITQTTATLNGSISNPDNVTITAQGFEWKATAASSYTTVNATGTTMSAPLSGLTANTEYTFRAFVTTANGTHYGADLTFTTLEEVIDPCDVPTGLTVGTVTHESIAISWNANPNVSTWNIQYRPVGGTLSSATSTTNSYTITGLAPLTEYQIQVQAVCSNGQTSDWTAPVSATTLTGINEHLLNSIRLYPNPAKDVINVQCTMNNVQVESVEVFDVYGKLLQTVSMTPETTVINVSNLAAGMYFVRVTTEQGAATKSFVKK